MLSPRYLYSECRIIKPGKQRISASSSESNRADQVLHLDWKNEIMVGWIQAHTLSLQRSTVDGCSPDNITPSFLESFHIGWLAHCNGDFTQPEDLSSNFNESKLRAVKQFQRFGQLLQRKCCFGNSHLLKSLLIRVFSHWQEWSVDGDDAHSTEAPSLSRIPQLRSTKLFSWRRWSLLQYITWDIQKD